MSASKWLHPVGSLSAPLSVDIGARRGCHAEMADLRMPVATSSATTFQLHATQRCMWNAAATQSASPWKPSRTKRKPPQKGVPARASFSGSKFGEYSFPNGSACGYRPVPTGYEQRRCQRKCFRKSFVKVARCWALGYTVLKAVSFKDLFFVPSSSTRYFKYCTRIPVTNATYTVEKLTSLRRSSTGSSKQ